MSRRRAAQMLLLATLFWAVSFPAAKALNILKDAHLPEANSWFVAGLTLVIRFGAGAAIIALLSWRTLRQTTWLEIWQGLGLGVFGGLGILFQVDGLAYTSASTSAFLTQCYCLLLPIIVAFRDRRWPPPAILLCSILVMAGVAVLARLDWRDLRLGRGETETLIGSVLFTGQILWLERPAFARNRVNHFTLVMFLTIALVGLPPLLAAAPRSGSLLHFLSVPAVPVLFTALVLFCTVVAFLLMNRWQPLLSAPEAGLIYCAEPVFTSLFALFLPGLISVWAGVNYPNETITLNLLIGGGLITVANALMQLRVSRTPDSLRDSPPVPVSTSSERD